MLSTRNFSKCSQIFKAEEAARDSRRTKQDRYEEMRRRKDEEREAQERMLVGLLILVHDLLNIIFLI